MTLDAETSASYFETLQLTPGSSPQQIHAQYRHLAKLYHPDRNPDRRAWSEERLRRLNEAYHGLADTHTASPPPAGFAGPAAWPQSAPVEPEHSLRPRVLRRVLRYLAIVGLVCGVSVAYSNWSQSPQGMTAAPVTNVAPPPAVSIEPPAALPPASPDTPAVPPVKPPGQGQEAALSARFGVEDVGVDAAVLRAAQIVRRVNAETQRAPQSRRTQKAEQLAADALELSRLQHSIRSGLHDLRAPTTQDLHRGQIADLQLALFQLARQQHLVTDEVAAFPAK